MCAKKRAMRQTETKQQTSAQWLKSAAGKRAKEAAKNAVKVKAPKHKKGEGSLHGIRDREAVKSTLSDVGQGGAKSSLGEVKGPHQGAVEKAATVKLPPNFGHKPGDGEQIVGPMVARTGLPTPKHVGLASPKSPAPHGVVRARAGTGKTFTLVMGVAYTYADRALPGGGTLWGKCVKQLGFDPKPSPQQAEVWEFMAREKPRSVLYVAFNSAIVREFSEKWKWLVDALASVGVQLQFQTVHSLGWEACRKAYSYRNPFKAIDAGGYKTKDLLSVVWGVDLNEVWEKRRDEIDAIVDLVSLCKLTLAGLDPAGIVPAEISMLPGDEQLDELVSHYQVDLGENGERKEVFDSVRKVLQLSREQTEKVMFDDQIWLPVVNNLPITKYDLVLGDEAQDWNRCQQEIILKAGRRLLVVGDERQAIYGFAGADVDSIPRMQQLLGEQHYPPRSELPGNGLRVDGRGVLEFPLTVTRRCGKAIVQEANKWVPEFEAHPDNGQGEVFRIQEEAGLAIYGRDIDPRDSGVAEETVKAPLVKGQDMVLCRINAPLIKLAFQLLRETRAFELRGGDMQKNLKWLIRKSKATEVSAFISWLDDYEKKTAEKVRNRKRVDEDALIILADKCECLREFALHAHTIKELYANIDEVFGDGQRRKAYTRFRNGPPAAPKEIKPILLSSIHRAKGLEAKRVFILRPDLLPHPKAVAAGGWQKGQEENLAYVAVTRAIEQLVYVDQKGGE